MLYRIVNNKYLLIEVKWIRIKYMWLMVEIYVVMVLSWINFFGGKNGNKIGKI